MDDKVIEYFVNLLSYKTKRRVLKLVHLIESCDLERVIKLSDFLIDKFGNAETDYRSSEYYTPESMRVIRRTFKDKTVEIDSLLYSFLQDVNNGVELNPDDLEKTLSLAKEINRLVNFN